VAWYRGVVTLLWTAGSWACRAVRLATPTTTAGSFRRRMEQSPTHRLAAFLALNRTMAVVLLTVLLFGLGEELWARFMPAYLDALRRDLAHEAGQVGQVGWTGLVRG